MKINRREFTGISAGLTAAVYGTSSEPRSRYPGSITDIEGLAVGHFTHPAGTTGCTVLLCGPPFTGGVDVRGSAPGTRETDLLRPTNMVEKVDAVLLAGGSAFGLDAASGVVRFLEENKRGFPAGVARVPIVPAAILFDLSVGNPKHRPDLQAGYEACRQARSGAVPEGSLGAGAGATIGKIKGMNRAMKGGIGTASIRIEGLIVGALFAVNAIGDVVDPDSGKILAGLRTGDGKHLEDSSRLLRTQRIDRRGGPGKNTTIGIVATNATLTKSQVTKIAQMSHDGLARAVRPSHLPFDGDTIFALSREGGVAADLGQVGALAAEVTGRAIVNAILAARSVDNIPAYLDLLGT